MSSTASQSPIQHRGSTANGSYYFCIEGLPKRYTWQDLKDLVRREAAHGIWTEMAYYRNGQSGETGWARLQRRDEAARLYRFLTSNAVEGRRLRVHLFDTSVSPPQLIAHTCGTAPCVTNGRPIESSRPPATSASQTAAPYSAYVGQNESTYAVQPASPYAVSPAVMLAPPPAQVTSVYSMQVLQAKMQSMGMNTADPAVIAASRARLAQAYSTQQQPVPLQGQNPAQAPVYIPTSAGTYVNVGQGAVKTEIRGIFISNIDYKASSKDLQAFFGKAGEIVKCQLLKDPATGKSKGNATVQYASAKDAKKAVGMFNNEKWMSMRLKVRLDKEPIAVGTSSSSKASTSASNGRLSQSRNSTEPIIVNGSVCSK